MKKRFLPFSLLFVIMILGQAAMADQVGHYVPRDNQTHNAESYLQMLRANQSTGLVDPAWMMSAPEQNVKDGETGDYPVYWVSMGPDDLGGRTTSILYSNQLPNVAFIGSMGGGVYITWNKGITWHQVGDNLMVSSMAQAEDGTIYVGTGDGGAAYSFNSLTDYSYTNSFIGSGLYMINTDREMSFVESTKLLDPNDPEDEWAFINSVAVDGNNVIVATNTGVRYLKEGEWVYAQVVDTTAETGFVDLAGKAIDVKVGKDHVVIASVDKKLYVGTLDAMTCVSAEDSDDLIDEGTNEIIAIGVASNLLDIAIDPTDNTIYAANIDNKGNHINIYASSDLGGTWRIILPTVEEEIGHQVYGARGHFNHGITLDPVVSGRFYVTAKDLWVLERSADTTGLYVAAKVSSEENLHIGVNAIAFNPNNGNEAYVATDGGIFKGTRVAGNEYFNFTNCNRGFLSTRCLGIAPSGKVTRVAAGVLDHGPILINGIEGTNNLETANLLLPEPGYGAHFGVFDKSYNCGYIAVSLIQPDAIIMTTASGAIRRTKTAGADYDISNFNTSTITSSYSSTSRFQLPMAFWESFDDEYNTEEVWFKCRKDMQAGTPIICHSNTGDYSAPYPDAGYPFEEVLPIDLHFNELHPDKSDSVSFHDPISTKLFFPRRKDNKNFEIYYSTDGIRFGKVAVWNKIATINNSTNYAACPTCMTVSKDGDHLFVGTLSAGIARISNLRQAVDSATFTPTSSEFAPTYKKIELPASVTKRCVTSISVYPNDPNKIVVTLGSYGNDCYVLYSDNALSDEPTFTEKQGDLDAMPVYSSVFTSTYKDADTLGHVLIGTEHGVYRTTNITAESPEWVCVSENMGKVPVLEMRQQLVKKDEVEVVTEIDSVTSIKSVYPGTNNEGVIYAATYGRGLFRCDAYRQNSGASVPETPAVVESKINMYPNPVRDAAKVSFELKSNAVVSYQVYDMSGRLVSTESLGHFTEGKHEVSVSVNGLAKGAYVLRLNAGTQTSSVRFMVF